jgi:hypothetical protein
MKQITDEIIGFAGSSFSLPEPQLRVSQSGVGEELVSRLPRSGDGGSNENQELCLYPVAHERGGESSDRLANDNELVGLIADCLDDAVCIVGEVGGVVA